MKNLEKKFEKFLATKQGPVRIVGLLSPHGQGSGPPEPPPMLALPTAMQPCIYACLPLSLCLRDVVPRAHACMRTLPCMHAP